MLAMVKTKAKNAGRPRKEGPRTDTGRLSRSVVHSIDGIDPATVKRLVEKGLLEARTLGLGTPLGELMMSKRISTLEFSAGRLWDRLMRQAHTALCSPKPDPKGSSLGQGNSGQSPDVDSEAGEAQAKEHARIAAAANAAISRVETRHSKDAVREMRRLCEGLGESLTSYEALLRVKSVLSDLADWWESTKKPARGLN